MKRKRLLCVVLTLALLIAAQSAAAAQDFSTIIEAWTRLPVIEVTVPSTGSVLLNPYGLEVFLGEDEATTDQIISVVDYIFSESEVALDVDVSVIGQVNEGSTMKLTTSSTKGSADKTKRAFIYFEMQSANTDDPARVTWDSAYDANKHILVGTSTASKKKILQLPPLTIDGEIPKEDAYGMFRLSGDAVASPENDPWTGDDGLSISIAYTFTPVPFV